jgi:hypothetical protein
MDNLQPKFKILRSLRHLRLQAFSLTVKKLEFLKTIHGAELYSKSSSRVRAESDCPYGSP